MVCKEWLVLEDGALAYQLQQEEVSQHLSKNKERNAVVREDFPRAKLLQREAEEEAARLAKIAEERDRRLAEELAAELRESSSMHHRFPHRYHPRVQEEHLRQSSRKVEGDINTVGLPLPHSPCMAPAPTFPHLPRPSNYNYDEIEKDEEDWPAPPPPASPRLTPEPIHRTPEPPPPPLNDSGLSKEEQELRDMELAARLQDEEALSEDLDRKLAIEAQDEELARLLQEKERARARRAREKAKARKLQGSGSQPGASTAGPGHLTTPTRPPPVIVGVTPAAHLTSGPRPHEIPNIAMAIDPTYQRYNTTGERRKANEDIDERIRPTPHSLPSSLSRSHHK